MASAATAAIRLQPSLVRLDASPADSRSAIETAVRMLVEEGHATAEYLDDVWEREGRTTSYIGNHVAIPHGLDPTRSHILTSAVSLVQVPEGVPFGDEVAYLVFGIAGKDDEHLPLLSGLALALADEDNVEALRRAPDLRTVNAILAEAER